MKGRANLTRAAFRSAEVRRPVVAGDRGLTVDQERFALIRAAASTIAGKRSTRLWLLREAADPRAIPAHHQRQPLCLSGRATFDGRHGSRLRGHGRRIGQRRASLTRCAYLWTFQA
jgi:hypothetical protein